ncbi:MAG: peptidoglycan DD-metalloendopeptidase family protein [Gammaproteobacteria bacterium]|nr:peptidoglycan DD-metalloendopeptidase family protein [Gammaproteobacteria bacterium]
MACTGAMHSRQSANLYAVRHGDSLYAVAWRYGLDYKRVALWNGIGAPYTIYPGQQLLLNPPLKSISVKKTRPKRTKKPSSPKPPPITAQSTIVVPKTSTVPAIPNPIVRKEPIEWHWPVKGKVIKSFSIEARGKKGIDIAGSLGQSIKAASGGKVVYSGGGLSGYGQLIIIKHDNRYLSAYAHNRSLMVKEGDRVRVGQKIAELGSTGADRPKLHFEIRQDGNPVDPLRYLPK